MDVHKLVLTGTASILIGLLSATACGQERGAEPARTEPQAKEPGTRHPIDGLHGVEAKSILSYAQAPDEQRPFDFVYVFPDRARWEFELPDGSRHRVFRKGIYVYQDRGGSSQPAPGATYDRLIGELELRRAALIWPHGFEWTTTEAGHEATLASAWKLRAVVDAKGGRPTSLWLVTPSGLVVESLREITWRASKGRTWPATLQFWHGDSKMWDETFEWIFPARYIDSFFTPPDRRDASAVPHHVDGLQDLQPYTALRIELPVETTWKKALEEERRLRDLWTKKLSTAIAERPTFELGPEGLPVATLLRVEPPMEEAPAGWAAQARRKGLVTFMPLDGLDDLDRERMDWMRSRVPPAARAEASYVRIDEASGRVQVVQPFVRR